MPRGIDIDRGRALAATLIPLAAQPLAAVLPDADIEIPPLPRDLPPWAKDAIAVSQRARDLIARFKPVVIGVLTFWDHRIRSAFVAGKRIAIDPSGSYKLEAGRAS
ncbi:MAG TPA: hypothetical protein VMS32_10005 [Verrucomicrobiae bacterium]|nr:hypothetical protein [Verrucomicrobiae bacterium]